MKTKTLGLSIATLGLVLAGVGTYVGTKAKGNFSSAWYSAEGAIVFDNTNKVTSAEAADVNSRGAFYKKIVNTSEGAGNYEIEFEYKDVTAPTSSWAHAIIQPGGYISNEDYLCSAKCINFYHDPTGIRVWCGCWSEKSYSVYPSYYESEIDFPYCSEITIENMTDQPIEVGFDLIYTSYGNGDCTDPECSADFTDVLGKWYGGIPGNSDYVHPDCDMTIDENENMEFVEGFFGTHHQFESTDMGEVYYDYHGCDCRAWCFVGKSSSVLDETLMFIEYSEDEWYIRYTGYNDGQPFVEYAELIPGHHLDD